MEHSETKSTSEEKGSEPSKVNLPAFFGIKAGMTRSFDKDGNHIPMTVIKLIPNVIVQVKTKEQDGYEAYQLGFFQKREKLVTMPVKGQLQKAKTPFLMTRFAEIRPTSSIDTSFLGRELAYGDFQPRSYIDISGPSKGKGFQGVIKRYGFSGGPGAHGSRFHRTTGSIGNNALPSKVFKNKKMPGHMGHKKVTVQNIMIVDINEASGYLLLKGSVPGWENSFVRIAKAVKKKGK